LLNGAPADAPSFQFYWPAEDCLLPSAEDSLFGVPDDGIADLAALPRDVTNTNEAADAVCGAYAEALEEHTPPVQCETPAPAKSRKRPADAQAPVARFPKAARADCTEALSARADAAQLVECFARMDSVRAHHTRKIAVRVRGDTGKNIPGHEVLKGLESCKKLLQRSTGVNRETLPARNVVALQALEEVLRLEIAFRESTIALLAHGMCDEARGQTHLHIDMRGLANILTDAEKKSH